MSFLRDIIESTFAVAYAEEPEEVEAEEVSQDAEEEEGEGDEDDEDELSDPLNELREECGKAPACVDATHHFHECVKRVTEEMEEPDYNDKAYKEDCVEEFFHLEHLINDCVAPKLFYKLK